MVWASHSEVAKNLSRVEDFKEDRDLIGLTVVVFGEELNLGKMKAGS